MSATLRRLCILGSTLLLGGCAVCNVSQVGGETWQFTGLVDRIYTPDGAVPGTAKFDYTLRFNFQQPDQDDASGQATYTYTGGIKYCVG